MRLDAKGEKSITKRQFKNLPHNKLFSLLHAKVYFYLTGRMNMSALSQKDVDNVAESMVAAIKNA